MQEIENNALFWQKVDTLVLSSSIEIDYPKGSKHKQFTNLVYPVDYGYLTDTIDPAGDPIHIYQGSKKTNRVDALVISADILWEDCVVKFLLGCDEKETLAIMEFLNQTDFQKAVLIRRGSEIPNWASND